LRSIFKIFFYFFYNLLTILIIFFSARVVGLSIVKIRIIFNGLSRY